MVFLSTAKEIFKMMLFKSFNVVSGSDTSTTLEEQVKKWLMENQEIEIKHVVQSGSESRHVLSIFYSKK